MAAYLRLTLNFLTGQPGAVVGDAGAAKEDDIARVARDQKIIGDRGAVGEEAHERSLTRIG